MRGIARYWAICLLAFVPAFMAYGARPGLMLARARQAMTENRYEVARQIADSVMTLSHNALTQVEALDLLAHADRALGDFAACDDAYKRALQLFTTSPSLAQYDNAATDDGRMYANMLLNYAQFQLALGRTDECMETLSRIPDGNNNTTGEAALRAMGVRATLAYRQDNPREALRILDEAIAKAQDSPSLPMLIQNRGFILNELRQYEQAYADLSHAAEILRGDARANAMASAALALAGTGDVDGALSLADRALSMLSAKREDNADYLIALRKKGEILINAGRKAEGVKVLRQFFDAERSRLIHALGGMPAQMRLDYWTMERPRLSQCLLAGDADASFMMDVALTRRELSLPDLRGRDDSRQKATAADLHRRLKPGQAAVAFILAPDVNGTMQYAAVTLPYRGKPRFISLFPDTLVSAPATVGDMSLADAIAVEDPGYKNILYRDTTLAERIWRPVLDALPSDVREIHFAPEGVFHLLGIENMPFRGAEDYKLIRHFSLLDMHQGNSGKGEALVVGGLDYDHAPTSATMTADAPAEDAGRNNMAYSELRRSIGANAGNRIFGYLPGTAAEAASVAAVIPGAVCRDTLSEEEFKNRVPGVTTLHVATHGYSLDCGTGRVAVMPGDTLAVDISLLRSGLALSGANVLGLDPRRQDGIISAREICDLDLSGVEMVVLSACQTAKGYITDESASGLIRALKIAGAGTIVATLWEVDDRATGMFMSKFHERRSAGDSTVDAFASARDALTEYGRRVERRSFSPAAMASRPDGTYIQQRPYADPWYWAPFILIDP